MATRAKSMGALNSMQDFNDYVGIAKMLELLAWASASEGGHKQAALLMGAAQALWRDAGTAITAITTIDPRMAEYHTPSEETVTHSLGPAAYAKALRKGGRHAQSQRPVTRTRGDVLLPACADLHDLASLTFHGGCRARENNSEPRSRS
ncbi:hypothetical protein R6V09_14365 [Streptomyces sp. W16]|uniref:hypothetical protein n=1 Tax=Streptomyces sp. W16 TaxID=3076631 RepID=UPI00295ACB77|nr:hypothetical protein [Streptomyces sp. W16]MDV9171300.1 hypothetical protein [Streptomyces sp. W16]